VRGDPIAHVPLRGTAGALAVLALGAAVPAGGCASRLVQARDEGLANFQEVDARVFRSAQPTKEGFAEARRRGVRTVLDLRSRGGREESLRGTGLAYVHVPMRQWSADAGRVAQALRVLVDPALSPVLVHCAQGRDRTGVVIAAYRVVYLGWSKEDAVREMVERGNARLWWNLRRLVRRIDPEAMRRRVEALPPPAVVPPR
jgi:protein tyrosine phosphatase (PTP) superfamily phosphohydrolase (DUF442 family)